jgi:hypothetical protein
MMADLATRGAVDIDKLQESYNILKKGSDDAQAIIQKNMTKMDADRKLLEDLKYEMVNNQRKGL